MIFFYFRVTVVQTKTSFWVKQDSSTLTYDATCGATSIAVSTALVALVALVRLIF